MNWIVQVAEYSDPPKVFSISYGIPEHYLTFYEIFVFDNEIKKLGLQGVTVLAASGTYTYLRFIFLVFTISVLSCSFFSFNLKYLRFSFYCLIDLFEYLR